MRSKKKILIIILIVALIAGATSGVSYVKRHFIEKHVNVTEAVAGDKISHDKKIMTISFTRVGNSIFDEGEDAVSGASLMFNGNELMGNCQLLSQMVLDAVGGDYYEILTEKKYPSGYAATCTVAGNEFKDNELPALVGELPELSSYDTIILVYPLWWNTIPMAVKSFLLNEDLSGKTLLPIVTHGGSKAGKSEEALKESCSANVLSPICIFDDDVIGCRKSLGKALEQALFR